MNEENKKQITIAVVICLMIMCCVGQIASCSKSYDHHVACAAHQGFGC
jgi:hypothetical protein